jgi:hypothetical protein
MKEIEEYLEDIRSFEKLCDIMIYIEDVFKMYSLIKKVDRENQEVSYLINLDNYTYPLTDLDKEDHIDVLLFEGIGRLKIIIHIW